MKVHAFAGLSPQPLPDAGGSEEDMGAPDVPPGTRITTFNAEGEAVSSSSPGSPAELEARRAAGAEKLARAPKVAPAAAPGAAPAQPPLSAAIAAGGNPERALRLRCLELAARSGETDPVKLMDRAKEFLAFVDG